MAISYLVKIDGETIPKLREWELERNKLWVDADRNMAGDIRSTFIGVFPKVILNFGHTTSDELQDIVELLDSPSMSVEYWDPRTKAYKTQDMYAGDYSTPIFDKTRELWAPFKVSLIAKSKYT